jgi:hypothetical protein
MNGNPMADEAGAQDDRLSLTPSKFPIVADWEDGQTYTITLKVEQISPGEFQVLSADKPGTPQLEEPGTEQQPEGEPVNEEKAPAGPPNPAVQRMMTSTGSAGRQPGRRGY